MDISESMVRHYLSDIAVSYFNHEDMPPDDVSGYAPQVQAMRRNADNHQDLPYLRLALEHLLANPDVPTAPLVDERYPYDEDEAREIIRFAWDSLWSGQPVRPAAATEIRLVPMRLEDWWEQGRAAAQQTSA